VWCFSCGLELHVIPKRCLVADYDVEIVSYYSVLADCLINSSALPVKALEYGFYFLLISVGAFVY